MNFFTISSASVFLKLERCQMAIPLTDYLESLNPMKMDDVTVSSAAQSRGERDGFQNGGSAILSSAVGSQQHRWQWEI